MPSIIQRPDPPTIVHAELRVSGLAETWTPLLNAPGTFNACDVWFQVDGSLEFQDTFRLFAINGPIKVPLFGERQIQQAKSIWKDQGGNRWSGILFSVRSRPCDGFKLEVAPATGGAARPRSQWRMECWWDCGGPYSDEAGRIMVDPWGIDGDPLGHNVDRYRTPPTGLPVGTTIISQPVELTGRWDLIYAWVLTDDPNSRDLTLQTRTPPATVYNAINLRIGQPGGFWEYKGCGVPGGYGGQWEAVLSGITNNRQMHLGCEWRRQPAYPAG